MGAFPSSLEPTHRRGTRERRPVERYEDYQAHTTHLAYVKEPEPTSFEEAISSPNVEAWKASINRELASIEKHDVWKSIDEAEILPKVNIIDSK